MTEPHTWTLPEEPPVGTVVGPVDDDGSRWKRFTDDENVEACWAALVAAQGTEVRYSFDGILALCKTVREYPDPADPGRWARSAPKEIDRDDVLAELSHRLPDFPSAPGMVLDELADLDILKFRTPMADPDGRQSELDALRAENEQLRADLIDAAENLTQAEKDRDDALERARVAGELLGREQNDRAAAQREANRLKQVLESVGRAARQAVES